MRNGYIIFSLIILTMVWCASSLAEVQYNGSISVGQEYNDNVNETSNAKGDFTTIVSPVFNANYVGGRVRGSIVYSGDLRLFDSGQRQNEMLNNLEAQGAVDLVEKVLVVDVSDSNHMVYNNSAMGQPSPYESTNQQTNQNIVSGGITFTPNVAERTKVSLAYRASEALYDNTNDVNKLTHDVILDVLHELTPKLELGGTLTGERQDTTSGDLSRFMASAVARYTYAEGCYLYGRFGLSDTAYDIGKNTLYPIWSAGLNHTWGRTTLTLDSQGGYDNNPNTIYNSYHATYSASLTQIFQRTRITANASYSDYSGQGTPHSRDTSAGLQIGYDLTPRLTVNLSGNYVNTNSSQDNLNRLYGSAELTYALPKDFSVTGYYRHKLSDSQNVSTSRYQVNIIGIKLSKAF
jgi:hypothetical protein